MHKASALIALRRRETFRLSVWVLGPVLAVCLLSPESAFGQLYVNISESESLGSDGTLYATGVTDAGGMPEHSAVSAVWITSPTGRTAQASASVPSGGIARSEAFLPSVQNDLGDYTIYTNGSADCSVTGWFGSGFASARITIGTSRTTYKATRYPDGSCELNAFCEGITPTCNQSPLVAASCPHDYSIVGDVWYTKSGLRYCFRLGIGVWSDVPGRCS